MRTFVQTGAAILMALSFAVPVASEALAAPAAGGGGGRAAIGGGGGGGGGGLRAGGGGNFRGGAPVFRGGGPRMGAPRLNAPRAFPRSYQSRPYPRADRVPRFPQGRFVNRPGGGYVKHHDGRHGHHRHHRRYYGYGYPLALYDYDYGYRGGCGWLWERWLDTGNPIWRTRYYDCID